MQLESSPLHIAPSERYKLPPFLCGESTLFYHTPYTQGHRYAPNSTLVSLSFTACSIITASRAASFYANHTMLFCTTMTPCAIQPLLCMLPLPLRIRSVVPPWNDPYCRASFKLRQTAKNCPLHLLAVRTAVSPQAGMAPP